MEAGGLGSDVDYDLDIIEELYVDFVELDSIAECEKAIRTRARQHAISWQTFSASLHQFLEIFSDEDAALLQVSGTEIRQLLQSLQRPSAWTFLRKPHLPTQSAWHRPLQDLEQFCISELEAPSWTAQQSIPRSFGRERYILHLFSGRRRRGDFQFYVDSLQHLHGGLQIFVLSIDIVIDDHWCDLSRRDSRRFWISAIHDKQIVALIGGPPCETWSRARGKPLLASTTQRCSFPRVIRTLDETWGLSSLSLRELAQIKVGNLLMGFQLIAMAALSCSGGVAILEHPAAPPEEDKASIWRTPIMQLLLKLPEFFQLTIAQGLWGAQSAKPTTLAVLNAPNLCRVLHQGRVTTELPHGISIGRDDSGAWSTSKLKEYPPGLCLALAQGILEALSHVSLDENIQVSSQLKELSCSLVCTEYGDTYGPDFASGVLLMDH